MKRIIVCLMAILMLGSISCYANHMLVVRDNHNVCMIDEKIDVLNLGGSYYDRLPADIYK